MEKKTSIGQNRLRIPSAFPPAHQPKDDQASTLIYYAVEISPKKSPRTSFLVEKRSEKNKTRDDAHYRKIPRAFGAKLNATLRAKKIPKMNLKCFILFPRKICRGETSKKIRYQTQTALFFRQLTDSRNHSDLLPRARGVSLRKY